MSEEVKQEQNEKVAQAVQERYLDTFLKCASAYGINPSSEEDVENMLKIASRIREIQEKQEPAVKEAATTCIKEACEALYALEI